MVVKIQPPSNMIEATISYNEKKADGPEGIRNIDETSFHNEDGHVVATINLPEGSTLEDEFERLKLLNSKKTRGRNLEKEAFHMSVNPGIKDRLLSEAEIVHFVRDMMDELGYGANPYRIYKHTDIERVHYHVVSTRIGQDGKKINDSFENKRINKIVERLAKKYGYVLGLDEEYHSEKIEDSTELKSDELIIDKCVSSNETERGQRKFIPPFKKDSDVPISEQFRLTHEEAISWSFTTPEQYLAILKWRFNTKAIELEDGIHFIGLNHAKEVTNPISERELNVTASNDILNKCNATNVFKLKSQRKRIETYAQHAMKDCPSFKEFRRRMHSKGIYVVISFTENGQPFGVTWLDRATKCAFKGSETTCTLDWLKNKAAANGWIFQREHPFDKTNNIEAESYKSRYRIVNDGKYKGEASDRKNKAEMKKMMTDKDERSSAPAIDKSSLNDDSNNIKI